MSKKLIALVAIMAVAMAGTAFAAVENLKVSGNYTAMGIDRHSYDLGSSTETFGDDVSVMASVTNLKFDADLTEDVMFTYIMRDERVFGGTGSLYTACAFATLKDFLSYPMTLKVGFQPVKLGSGLVIADPDTNRLGGGTTLLSTETGLGDLSPRKAFSAITSVIDLSPATLTLGWIKASEGDVGLNDDTNAYIINLGYNFEDYNTMAEVYGVWKDTTEKTTTKDDIKVYGIRSVSTLLDSLTLSAEAAYQEQKDARSDGKAQSNQAYQLAINYAFLDMDYAPTIGFDYSYLSANWDPMYEAWTPANIANVLFPNSNVNCYGVTLTAEPREDMSASLRYAYLVATDKPGITSYPGTFATYTVKADEDKLGSEIDFALTYDYTEDVQFGFNFDVFMPGDWFDSVNEKEAVQALGSMKVSF